LWAGIACHKCVDVIYCDENCRNKAWQEYHDIECSVISAISSEELNSLDSLTLRLTVKAYKEAGTLEKLQEKIHKIDKIDDPLIKCLTDNVFDSANYASVYSLSRQTEDLFMNTVRASVILYSLAATTNIFGEKINDFGELSKNKYAAFIGGLIKTNFEISLMNSTKLTLDGDTGLIVDSFWSMLNHSCDPTVINFASGDISALIAFQRILEGEQRIQEGEQIFLSYGPEFIYDKRDKRREDLKKFEFDCECTACIQNWGPYSHLFFPSHRLTCLSMDLKQKLKFAPTVDKFSNDFDTIFGNLDDELEIISAALDLLDFYQSNHGYPTREIMELKKFVREAMAHESEALNRWIAKKYMSEPEGDFYDYCALVSDESKIKIALQYLSAHEHPINIRKNIKCTSRALAYIEKGNKTFESSSWEDLSETYTKAAMYAEIDSNELARAYGNRSASLYTGGLFEDALIDIERALAIGYNDNTKTK
ncbi:hypothetical protein PV326_013140, partial [Microctonus aethiopoides]